MLMIKGNEFGLEMTVAEKRNKEAMVQFLFNTYKKYYPRLLEKREREAMEAAQAASSFFMLSLLTRFPTRVKIK